MSQFSDEATLNDPDSLWALRYRLRAHIRDAKLAPPSYDGWPDDVLTCGRVPQRGGQVQVGYDPGRRRGVLLGLRSCWRPYCSWCGPILRARRGRQWQAVFAGLLDNGATCAHFMNTQRHTPRDGLYGLFWGHIAARGKWPTDRRWKAMRRDYDLISYAYATEPVHRFSLDPAEGGWNVHTHWFPWSRRDLSPTDWNDLRDRAALIHCDTLKEQGLEATRKAGVRLVLPREELGGALGWADYGTKSGQYEYRGPALGYQGWRSSPPASRGRGERVDTKGMTSDELLYESMIFHDGQAAAKFHELASVLRSSPPWATERPRRGPTLYHMSGELRKFAGVSDAEWKALERGDLAGADVEPLGAVTATELLELVVTGKLGTLRGIAGRNDPHAVADYLRRLMDRPSPSPTDDDLCETFLPMYLQGRSDGAELLPEAAA